MSGQPLTLRDEKVAVPPPETVGEGDYEVQPGDGICSIAFDNGHFWQTLWDWPANSVLKKKRGHPHVLVSGDLVTIPPLRPKVENRMTDLVHRFRRRGVPARIHFVIRKEDREPFQGKKYKLEVGDATYEGVTDGNGQIQHWLDLSARDGELTVWLDTKYYPETYTCKLLVSHLEPVESFKGVQQRLNHLGFFCGDEDGQSSPDTTLALKAFQANEKLKETGEADEATRQKLSAAYGM